MRTSTVLIQEILKSRKVRDLIYQKESDTVGSCLGKLDDNQIHSIAVFDNEEKKLLGLIDYLDLIIYLIESCVKKMESRVTPPSDNLSTDDFEIMIKRSNEFHLKSILESKMINKSKKDPLYEVEDSKSLWYVCEVFALGLHRVVIKDDKGNRTIFSQSDVVSWLAIDTESKLGDLSNKTIKELDLGNKDVVTINQDEKAIDAFFKLKENNLSGVGVVDNDGSLVGNFSSSDLKGIRHFNFYGLLNSAKNYIHQIRKNDNQHRSDVVWVIDSTPFKTLIKRFSERRVHSIFVVKPETMKPISIITLTDLLSKIPMDHD